VKTALAVNMGRCIRLWRAAGKIIISNQRFVLEARCLADGFT